MFNSYIKRALPRCDKLSGGVCDSVEVYISNGSEITKLILNDDKIGNMGVCYYADGILNVYGDKYEIHGSKLKLVED